MPAFASGSSNADFSRPLAGDTSQPRRCCCFRLPECCQRWSVCTAPLEVRLVLLSMTLLQAATEISVGALFDAYLLIILGTNSMVGAVETGKGLTTLLLAIPLGWTLDKWSIPRVLRYNTLVGCLGALCLLLGYPSDTLWLVITGCIILAIHNQLVVTAFPVLLSQTSTSRTLNSVAQANLQSASSAGRTLGPLFQLVLIGITRNAHWTETELHWLLVSGLAFFAMYVPLMYRVTVLHEAQHRQAEQSQPPQNSSSNEATTTTSEPRNSPAASSSPFSSSSSSSSPAARGVTPKRAWIIAGLCEFAGLVCQTGSGMTFKYWTLFFKKDYGFSPAAACMMNVGTWGSIAVANQLIQPLLSRWGRMATANLMHFSATFMLFLISLSTLATWVEVPLVITRNGTMNTVIPIITSVILSLVPKQHQGKWSALASMRRASWCGSAFIGGWLSDSHDYRYAFFITACFHSAALFIQLIVQVLLRLWVGPSGQIEDPSQCSAELSEQRGEGQSAEYITGSPPTFGGSPPTFMGPGSSQILSASPANSARGANDNAWPEAQDARRGASAAGV